MVADPLRDAREAGRDWPVLPGLIVFGIVAVLSFLDLLLEDV